MLLKFSAHGRNVKVLVAEEFVRVDAISRFPCTLSQLFCWFYLIKVEIEIIDFFLEGIDLTCQWAESRCNQSRHFHRWQHDLSCFFVWGGIFLIHVFILQKNSIRKRYGQEIAGAWHSGEGCRHGWLEILRLPSHDKFGYWNKLFYKNRRS